MKILIVEDELLIGQSLKKLLEKKNAVVQLVSNGKDAIVKIQSEYFDRIICDLMLQDITGFDVIEESKKRYTLAEIGNIFIIMTAYSSPSVLEKAKSYGCNILQKPFENLEKTLHNILQKQTMDNTL